MLTAFALGISAGILGQVYFVGGNIGISWYAIPTILQSPTTGKLQVDQWAYVYNKGKKWFPVAALSSALGFAVAAYSAPFASVERAAIISAVVAILPVPYTFATMLPTIKKLEAFQTQTDLEVKASQDEATALINKWNKLSVSRMLIASVALINGIAIVAGAYT